MMDIVDCLMTEPRFMSGVPVVLSDGVWRVFTVPEGHPLAERIRGVAIVDAARANEEQKGFLDKLHAKQGRDVFVASTIVIQDHETRRLWSYGTWARGVVTLLPETGHVMLGSSVGADAGLILRCPFPVVAHVCADLTVRERVRPARWLVERFPSDAQLAELRAAEGAEVVRDGS